mmetsp:Transcript_1682/g.4449  ORF Transcript_1682/g.4449 Transcript_1682/m.4449 type:complete len:542 (-) Transcript_1682:1370-2995(-)
MHSPSASEEAAAYRLLIKYGRRDALRELVKQRESAADLWPDEALLSVVTLLISKGAEQVEDPNDEHCTLNYARHRFGVTTNAGLDIGPCSRLLALLLSTSSQNPTCKSMGQHGPGGHHGSRMQQQQQCWGDVPVADVRTVMLHVLRAYSKDQQRTIAATHPDCATALLAAACGCGPPMRDVVHWALSHKADVNGLVLPKPKRSSKQQQQPSAPTGETQHLNGHANGHHDALSSSCCDCSKDVPCTCPDNGDGTAYLECAGAGAQPRNGKQHAPKAGHLGGQDTQQQPDKAHSPANGHAHSNGGCEVHRSVQGQGQGMGKEQEPELCTYVFSPLAEAAAAGDRYLVELLMEVHGADPTAHGGLAEACARNTGQLQVANLIFEKCVAQRAARAAAAGASGCDPASAADSDAGAAGAGVRGPGAMYGGSSAAPAYQYVTFSDWLASAMPRWRLPRLPRLAGWLSPSSSSSRHHKHGKRSSRSSASASSHYAASQSEQVAVYTSTAGAGPSRTAVYAGAGLVLGGVLIAGVYLSRRQAASTAKQG